MLANVDPSLAANPSLRASSLVLFGLESSGKSALFRGLTGDRTGAEQNFRGSTVVCRSGSARFAPLMAIVDTPGLQESDDTSTTTQMALATLRDADTVALVIRATTAARDLEILSEMLNTNNCDRPVFFVVTFADRAAAYADNWASQIEVATGIPAVALDARLLTIDKQDRIAACLTRAKPFDRTLQALLPQPPPAVFPSRSLLDRKWVGALTALALVVLLFAVPVYAAFVVSSKLQSTLDAAILDRTRLLLTGLLTDGGTVHALLVGSYGVMTLGVYSFVWAFPVVLFIGLSMALTDETGLRDRIALALDPVMRPLGMSGRDLVPMLSGFGCNVVAVLQSRTCSRTNRKRCITLVAFGASCSYQLGASLSVFSMASKPWMFAPFVTLVLLVGLVHTRISRGRKQKRSRSLSLLTATWLQPPTLRGVWWRIRSVCKQFFWQAMPIFLVICLVSALLAKWGVLAQAERFIAPFLTAVFDLPGSATPAIVFSVLRKDGILLLNETGTDPHGALGAGQLFLAVYFAATLSPCLVTIYTISREIGTRSAVAIAGRQLAMALGSTLVLALAIRLY